MHFPYQHRSLANLLLPHTTRQNPFLRLLRLRHRDCSVVGLKYLAIRKLSSTLLLPIMVLVSLSGSLLAQQEDIVLKSEFVIKSDDGKDTLFAASHVRLHYSADSSHVSIEHEALYRLVFQMPYHKLSMDHLEVVWDRLGKKVYFHSNDTHDRFYFTDPEKMKLEFSSTDGVLDLQKKTLSLKSVPGIYAGNALIIPVNHEVVMTGPKLPVLPKAQVILNSFTRYHHLVSNNVEITSRKDFSYGEMLHYEYYHAPTRKTYRFEEVSLSVNKIIEEFKVSFETIIELNIQDDDQFELFKGQYFKGIAVAKDWEEDFEFKGFIGKKPRKKDAPIKWIPYEGKEQLGRF